MKLNRFASIMLLVCVSARAQYTTGYFETPEYLKSGSLSSINASSAYVRGYTGKNSTIAIIDTGIDLKSNQFTNRIVGSKDFTNSTNGVQDILGHGTHVAGIAAASRDNVGIEGVAYDANLLIARVSVNGSMLESSIQSALNWASANNATVANLSAELGYVYTTTKVANGVYTVANMTNTPNYWTKITATNPNSWVPNLGTNTVLVVAAGNSGTAYTAGFGQLATATDAKGNLLLGGRVIIAGDWNAQFNMLSPTSNAAGSICMTYTNGVCQDKYKISDFYLMAPGINITSTVPTTVSSSGLAVMSGTSMSAPVISGAVAIIHQEWPQMTSDNIVKLLLVTANKNIPNYKVEVNGQGLLDLNKATQPLGTLNIPTTGRTLPVASSSPVLTTGGSASLGKVSSIMVLDSMNRDFYIGSKSFTAHATPYSFNASQAAMPYLTKNPYTQFNNYSNFVTNSVGNMEFTLYRDVGVDYRTDNTSMSEMSFKHQIGDTKVKYSVGGFSENGSWLGNFTSNGNAITQSFTTFTGANAARMLSPTTELTGGLYHGITVTNATGDYINSVGPVFSYSWNIGIEQHINEHNSVGFMAYQPVTVYRAMANTNIPVGLDSNYNTVYANNVNLAADVKEYRLGVYYKLANQKGSDVLTFLENRQNYMGQSGQSVNVTGVRINFRF